MNLAAPNLNKPAAAAPAPAPLPSPVTDVSATPPMILGFTDAALFNAAYLASRDPKVRAVYRQFAGIDPVSLQSKMAELAQQGYLIDPVIDAQLEDMGTAWDVTLQRLELGAVTVQGWNGTKGGGSSGKVLPCPPDLTPRPDPVVHVNEFVGAQLTGRRDGRTDVYEATGRGWQCPEGLIVTEADGFKYQRVGQLEPGDFIAQFVRLG